MAIGLHLYRRGAEKEGEPAEQTEADGKDGKSQTSCFQVRIVENWRAGKACKSEHFGDAADGTTDARTRQRVRPSVCRVSVRALQGIGGKPACHDNDWHPDGELPCRGEVYPKGVFNNSVSEGVQDFTEFRGLAAFAGDVAINGIECKDDGDDENQGDG